VTLGNEKCARISEKIWRNLALLCSQPSCKSDSCSGCELFSVGHRHCACFSIRAVRNFVQSITSQEPSCKPLSEQPPSFVSTSCLVQSAPRKTPPPPKKQRSSVRMESTGPHTQSVGLLPEGVQSWYISLTDQSAGQSSPIYSRRY
jgi:hypothetical protein